MLLIININVANASKVISSKVKFQATGKPAFLKINGEGKLGVTKLKIVGNKLIGSIEVDLNELDSGIELRDNHLKENYLETKKYPKAILYLDHADLLKGSSENTLEAVLELHGVKKTIEFISTIKINEKVLTVESEFSIKLSDFKIAIPSFQGITVSKIVKLNITAKIELD